MSLSFKRVLSFAFAIAIATLHVSAASAAAMGVDDARHLLGRTGFGPSAAEVAEYASLSRDAAIDRLLDRTLDRAQTPAPAWATESTRPTLAPDATREEREAFRREQLRRGLELRGWWVREMLATSSPLTERMTLFWHNHFTSGLQKVRIARFMYAQNVTLRANALGNFRTLLHAASTDPAMVLYLDSAQNRRGAPNENFAREVMELFTLGEGHYTEGDVKEAARAFTGWSIDRETGAFIVRARLHDDGPKTVLDSTGRFDGHAVLDLLLARPETSELVITKLWKEFVSPDPDPREVERIARTFRADYDIKTALRGLFTSAAFWDPSNRGALVKSPSELVVGTLRQLDLSPERTQPLALAIAGMGQNLFAPPNVRGWPGGDTWINSNTLLARKLFLDRLARNDAGLPAAARGAMTPTPVPSVTSDDVAARGDEGVFTRSVIEPAFNRGVASDGDRRAMQARQIERATRPLRFDAPQWLAQRDGATRAEKLASARRLLLPIEPQAAAPEDADITSAVHAALLDPAYQLK